MDSNTLSSVCDEVYKRFPEVVGSHPKEQNQPNENTLLIFRGISKTADGKRIERNVRVLVSPTGKIIKMTTSR